MVHRMRANFMLRRECRNVCFSQRSNVFRRFGNIKGAFEPVFRQHLRKLKVKDTAIIQLVVTINFAITLNPFSANFVELYFIHNIIIKTDF